MGRMDKTMQIIAIMQEFGWTYDEYMSNPSYILTAIPEKMKRDRKQQELNAKRK